MNPVKQIAVRWHGLFNRFAEDLYPGRYTVSMCQELAEKGFEAKRLGIEKQSSFLAHYYQRPEFHEIADKLGDSLALSEYAKTNKSPRVDFIAVAFMAQTAKIITRDQTRIYIGDTPQVLGCSLVFGTDHEWIERWKIKNLGGLLVAYINSDPYTKALSNFGSTSRNTDKMIAYAVKNNPGKKILVLPDKFLGYVMKARALELLKKEGITVGPDLIEVYNHEFAGNHACCYVHEQFGDDALEEVLDKYPNAVLMIHPECGCASSCLMKLQRGLINHKAYFVSTEQMINLARTSEVKQFVVATEPGLIYALRKHLPEKEFIPVSATAHCDFMKGNTFDKLIRSLREDRIEIVICEKCTKCLDPRHSYQDDKVVHIPRQIADLAQQGIDRMLAIQ